MTRVVKEHAIRRNEILDMAQQLVQTRGYEQMTIQNILDGLQIAKGTFYHYFGSKQALLDALLVRMQEEQQQLYLPLVSDPHLPALVKLQRFFDTLSHWKASQKTFILAMLRVWYTDDNALMRQKARASVIERVPPLLTVIVRQGIQEGVLSASYPDHAGAVVFSLILDISDAVAAALLSPELNLDVLHSLEDTVAAYTDAVERVLGAPSGSLSLVDIDTLKEWIISA